MAHRTMRSRTAVVAALLVLACVAQAAPISGSGSSSPDPEDENDEFSEEGSGSDALNIPKGEESSDACPNSPNGPCSGNGKCQKSEDQGMVCDCNPGYHGEDCGEMDDQFDVYYNRLMAQSKGQAFRGKIVLSDATLASWDTRIAGLKKRFAAEKMDTERYVNAYVDAQNHFLDAKKEAVDKHEAAVDALKSEVETMRKEQSDKIDADVIALRERIAKKVEANNEAVLRNADAMLKLRNTVQKGDTLGEETRMHRILEHWDLCGIHPNSPNCQEKKAEKMPGVHIVVETTNSAKSYPKSLAADELAQAKSGAHSGVVSKLAVKSKQR